MRNPIPRPLIALIFLITSLSGQLQEDRDNQDPVANPKWQGNLSALGVYLITSGGNRIVDLEFDQGTGTYAVSYLPNTGSYEKVWNYQLSKTPGQIASWLQAGNYRITDIEPELRPSGLTFSCLAEKITSSNQKTWWYLVNSSIASIQTIAQVQNARVVDLEQYTLGGRTYYAAVLIQNTGPDAKAWWWYTNLNLTTLGNLLRSNAARIWDLDVLPNGRINVVMVRSAGEYSWFAIAQTATAMEAHRAQLGGRILDIQQVGSQYTYVMTSAVTATADRTRDLMLPKSDGIRGFYLRRVPDRGAAYDLAGIHQDTDFEPAATLATMVHLKAMSEVAQGNASLNSLVSVASTVSPTNPCPVPTSPSLDQLGPLLQRMLRSSNTAAAKAVVDRFGGLSRMRVIPGVGLPHTLMQHDLGCVSPPNRTRLTEFGTMHEATIQGALGTQRESFYQAFDNSFYGANAYYADGSLTAILDDEAFRARLTATEKADFIAGMRVVGKGGGAQIGRWRHRSWAAYIRLPYWANAGPGYREYVTGAFVERGTDTADAIAAANTGATEVLRDEIRAAMATLKNHQAGGIAPFGTSCGAGLAPFVHTARGTPEIGRSFTLTAAALRNTSHRVSLEIGTSSTDWNGVLLPLDLAFLGAPGCAWRTNSLSSILMTATNGRAELPVTLPLDKNLIGLLLYTQFLIASKGNTAGLITTNGLRITIGGQR